jgi:glycosyltransferase involved in cell wall biosynthesis
MSVSLHNPPADQRAVALSDAPLVTVIICVYNAGEYLRESVLSVLNQTYRELEILIIDDGSTDGCVRALHDMLTADSRVRIIYQPNGGKPAAMNRALDEMRGDFYVINDADDLSHPRRIERQLQCFVEHPSVAAVFCGNELLLGNRRVAPLLRERGVEECRRCVDGFQMPAHDPTGMYRWSMVHKLRYSPELLLGEGFDYIMRVGEQFPMMVVGECLYSYRIHRNSITRRDPEKRAKLVLEAVRRAFERRGLDQTPLQELAKNGWQISNRDSDNNIAAHFMDSVCSLRKAGRRREALLAGLECARMHPTSPHYYKAMVYSVVPLWLVRHLRRSAFGTLHA